MSSEANIFAISPNRDFARIARKYLERLYDVRKFNWIGCPEKSDVLLYMRSDAPYKSLEDIRKASTPPKCGSTGTAGTDYILARMLEDTLGLKINTVLGYPGGSEIDLAVEKGEVQCRGMTAAPFFGREPFITWRKKNFVRVLRFGGQKRDERIPEAPTIYEIFEKEKTPEKTDVLPTLFYAVATSAAHGSPRRVRRKSA